jgi:signal peptidase II
MKHLRKICLVLGIVAVSTVLDQFTKQIAIQQFRGQPPVVYWDNLFRFDYAENPGAFLSLGATLSPQARMWVLSVAVGVFLAFLFIYLIRSPLNRLQTWALSFVLGGGVSNLIDRFFRPSGKVVDFMNMGIGGLRTGVFNVADMFIMAGIILFLLLNLKPSVDPNPQRE